MLLFPGLAAINGWMVARGDGGEGLSPFPSLSKCFY